NSVRDARATSDRDKPRTARIDRVREAMDEAVSCDGMCSLEGQCQTDFGSSSGPSKSEGALPLGKMFAVAGVQDRGTVRDAGHGVFYFADESKCFMLYA